MRLRDQIAAVLPTDHAATEAGHRPPRNLPRRGGDRRMAGTGVIRPCDAALGTDGPDRLAGQPDGRGGLGGRQQRQRGPDLRLQYRIRTAGVTLEQGFAPADQGDQAVADGRLNLQRHGAVGLGWKWARGSLWPRSTMRRPQSVSMGALISPVLTPLSFRCMVCVLTRTSLPRKAWATSWHKVEGGITKRLIPGSDDAAASTVA